MAKKEGKMKGKGFNKRRVKNELDLDELEKKFGKGVTLIACPDCIKYGLLSIVDYGSDNLDLFAKNKLIITCPVCQVERPREDNFGGEWWIPYHLPGVRKQLENISEVREPQLDDKDRFTKHNIG